MAELPPNVPERILEVLWPASGGGMVYGQALTIKVHEITHTREGNPIKGPYHEVMFSIGESSNEEDSRKFCVASSLARAVAGRLIGMADYIDAKAKGEA